MFTVRGGEVKYMQSNNIYSEGLVIHWGEGEFLGLRERVSATFL